MPKNILVVINPASGQPDTILNKLNAVFHEAGVRWDVSITHESGDGTLVSSQEMITRGSRLIFNKQRTRGSGNLNV